MLLGVDFETASACDLKTHGAWRYSQHPSTRVYCMAIGFLRSDGQQIVGGWQPGEPLPFVFTDAIVNPSVSWLAHNNAFEKAIWTNVLTPRYGWPPCPERWEDTQAHAAAANLPTTLEGLGRALGAPVQKDSEGHDLMLSMCKLTKHPLTEEWWNENDTPEKRARLLAYCETDVRSMLSVWQRIPKMIASEAALWRLDQKINDRGVHIDRALCRRMLAMVERRKHELEREMWDITDFDVLSSSKTARLKKFVKDRGVVLPVVDRTNAAGEETESESLGRTVAVDVLADPTIDPQVRAVLENRLEVSKATSLAKLRRVETLVDLRDDRLRHSLQFCAAHTGRWASRGLQLHNLPKDRREKKEAARINEIVYSGDLVKLTAEVERPLEAMSLALRGIVTAAPGFEIVGADFSAIEGRTCAWLAGQQDIVDAYADPSRDPYIEAAAEQGSTSRDFGKLLILQFQYGCGVLKAADSGKKAGIIMSLKDWRKVVLTYRKKKAAISAMWKNLENAYAAAVESPGIVQRVGEFLRIAATKSCLMILLPSGRAIRYWQPSFAIVKKKVETVDEEGQIIEIERVGKELRYFAPGKDADTMVPFSTYGSELAEHVSSGVARDCLGYALPRLADAGYPVVMHVHDSCAADCPPNFGSVEEFCSIMATVPPWAPGLPLAASGYRDTRFRG